MARLGCTLAASACFLAAMIVFDTSAWAIDLNGMWASDTGYCEKIFATQGNKPTFRKDSDLFGSGFIIDADRIWGRTAQCKILKSRTEGNTVYLMSSCATDIMLSNVELTLKVIDENKIDRVFPGFEGSTFTYFRCPSSH